MSTYRLFRVVATVLPRIAPLRARQRLAVAANRFGGRLGPALVLALLHDWATRAPDEFHHFQWSNHLGYSRHYNTTQIDVERLHPLRLELFELALTTLRDAGVDPAKDIDSFLDIGCSLGYVARYAETTAFPAAGRIVGIDIDGAALDDGRSYLARVGSRTELMEGNAAHLDDLFGDATFDVVFACGVVPYFEERSATALVEACLRHTSRVFCVNGHADSQVDNRELASSRPRHQDHSFVHNLDRMILAAGGRILTRRWGGAEQIGGNSVYFVIAEPGSAVADTTPTT